MKPRSSHPTIEDPAQVTDAQLERGVAGFDSWDICDQVVELFAHTPFAKKKIIAWSKREEEFVKRAAFALIAELAAHDKTMADEEFDRFFPIIAREATDERNFVKKAVNWALRNVGKRNRALTDERSPLPERCSGRMLDRLAGSPATPGAS